MKKYIENLKLISNPDIVLDQLLNKDNKNFKHLIFFNTHSYIETLKNTSFMRSVLKSKHIFVDGIGVYLSSLIFYKKKTKPLRITGYDFFEKLLEKINNDPNQKKLFFIGGEISNLENLKKKINEKYKNIHPENIAILSPPFGSKFKFNDHKIVQNINDFNPDIVFVGLGAPKQEKWVKINSKKLNCVNFLSIGAAFNFFTGLEKRAPMVFRKYGFEWLFRLILNPKKIFKRVFISGGIFIFLIITSYLFKKNFYNLKKIKVNIRLIRDYINFEWDKGYILSALNLASLGFLYKGDIKVSKNLFFWGDGIFHKIMIQKSKKIAGRQLIELIKQPKNIRKLHIIGNLTIKTKKFLSRKFSDLELKNSSLPYGDIKTIINDLPLVGEDEIIFLTLPTPKQEQVASYYHKTNKKLKIVCIGGGLAIAAGDEKEVPKLFDYLGLEWLWRLRYETKRRLKRLALSAVYMAEYILFGKYFKKIIVNFYK